jgi:assimilatory nitrate reductase catalytic subunit
MHWNDTNTNLARVDALIAPNPDPISGQPELKFTPVAAKPFLAAWYGFAVTAQRTEKRNIGYWAEARAENGFRQELAGVQSPENWSQFAEALLRSSELMAYVDERTGAFRYAAFENQRFMGALFVSREPVTVARDWLAEQLGKVYSRTDAFRVLAGRSGSSRDCGSTVCACNNVGKTAILSAIASGAGTLNAIGEVTKAGTSCGSCRAEIQGLLHGRHLQAAE